MIKDDCFFYQIQLHGVNFPPNGPVMQKNTLKWEPSTEKINVRDGVLKGDVNIFLCPTLVSCWLIYLHISLPSLKFTIFVNLSPVYSYGIKPIKCNYRSQDNCALDTYIYMKKRLNEDLSCSKWLVRKGGRQRTLGTSLSLGAFFFPSENRRQKTCFFSRCCAQTAKQPCSFFASAKHFLFYLVKVFFGRLDSDIQQSLTWRDSFWPFLICHAILQPVI